MTVTKDILSFAALATIAVAAFAAAAWIAFDPHVFMR
jgi:hypothetical protein